MRRLDLALPKVLRSRFARNWSLLVVSNLVCQALGMLATVRIARALSPDGFGQFNLVQTVAALGTVLAGMGLRNVVIRECARDPARTGAMLYASALLRAGLLAATGAGIILYSQVSQQGLSTAFSALAVGLLVGQLGWDLVESVAFGAQRMEYSAGINLAGSLVWVSGAWAAPTALLTPWNVTLAFVLLQAGKALAYAFALGAGRLGASVPRAQLLRAARLLASQSLSFYWLAILTAATSQLPIVFLAERSGQAEVGLYNAGFRLVAPLQMLVTTAVTALYPGLSQSSVIDGPRFARTVNRALLGMTLLGTAGALGVSLLRREVVLLLFGAAYRPAADAMAFQTWYTVLLSIYSLVGITLAARDKQRWLASLSTCYAAVATPVLWWGGGNGATGLAAAMLIAASVNMAYHWLVFQRSLPQPVPLPLTMGLLATLSGGAAVCWLVPADAPLAWRSVLAAFLVALLAIGLLREGLRRQSFLALRPPSAPLLRRNDA